jgi:hypothetical protein
MQAATPGMPDRFSFLIGLAGGGRAAFAGNAFNIDSGLPRICAAVAVASSIETGVRFCDVVTRSGGSCIRGSTDARAISHV